MLKSLQLKDFTVFPDSDIRFEENLNVVVGENGLGKTHLLKLAYPQVVELNDMTRVPWTARSVADPA